MLIPDILPRSICILFGLDRRPTKPKPEAGKPKPAFLLYTEYVKIALGQINPTVGDFSGNAAKIVEFSRRAEWNGAGLILFPELSVCGYPPRDLVERPSFVARNRETAEQIALRNPGHLRHLRPRDPGSL